MFDSAGSMARALIVTGPLRGKAIVPDTGGMLGTDR